MTQQQQQQQGKDIQQQKTPIETNGKHTDAINAIITDVNKKTNDAIQKIADNTSLLPLNAEIQNTVDTIKSQQQKQ